MIAAQVGQCATCAGPTYDDTRAGCTPYTCTTPCSVCNHPGDAHRDWYRKVYGSGFCRRCRPDEPDYRHDYQPATDRTTAKRGAPS